MIEVRELRKNYGDLWAVDGVDFSIGKGEIVGFLGPNGAGKTTTLRILAGYLPQNSGTVRVLDLDNKTDGLKIRRQVGYLPENNPLYETMEVSEYLSFLWAARRLGSAQVRQNRLKEVAASCGLESVIGKDIGELSKGYRQRVGLAGAILHDPSVLLLDEPTSGLDPIQARDVRDLIKSLKARKTILLSTHILPEVHAICDRVVIIHKGKLVADQPLKDLANSEEYVITVGFAKNLTNGEDRLKDIEGVTALEGPSRRGHEFIYRIRAQKDVRREVFELAASKHLPLVELKMEEKSLEEIFHELTR
ncbi:MAG: ATP-binding cassette domain-containing protein [Elusimicrobia bacterium]|nr:ATP-binding cassette domain-containing protein [Elusimicrobiota bacterium]